MSFLMVFWINSIKFRSNPTPRIIIVDQKLRQPWLINSMQQRHNAESFLGFSSNEEEIRKCIQDKLYRLFYGFYKPSVKLNTKIWRKSFKQENHPNINKISVDIKEMMLEDSRWKKTTNLVERESLNSLIITTLELSFRGLYWQHWYKAISLRHDLNSQDSWSSSACIL